MENYNENINLNNGSSNNSLKSLRIVVATLTIAITLILLIVGIVLVALLDNNIGNFILFACGIVFLVGAVTVSVILLIDETICNKCKTRYVYKYEYLGKTKTEEYIEDSENPSENFKHTEFFHKFSVTKLCPKCGNVHDTKVITRTGGHLFEFYDGKIIDKRIPYNSYDLVNGGNDNE